MNSILTEVKKLLNQAEEDTDFDVDIILAINTAFSILTQNGVGPIDGFAITSKETEWSAFIPECAKLNMVKSYVCTKARLLFDPPTSSSVLKVYEESAAEFLWRSQIAAEPKEEQHG